MNQRMRKLPTIFLLLALGLAAAAVAQPAQRVLDFYPQSRYPFNPPGASVGSFLTVQGQTFFFSSSGIGVTDGTPIGTRLLPSDNRASCHDLPQFVGSQKNVVFWLDCVGETRHVLWRSDGTAPGTFQLTSETNRLRVPDPDDFDSLYTFAGGFLYFPGCPYDGSSFPPPCYLWRTDGTREGTRAVADEPLAGDLVGIGKKVFFLSSNDSSYQLAVTDGTANGTVRLKSFDGERPRNLTAAGGKLFFLAGEDQELWVSNGTAAGTRAVSRFVPARPFETTRWLKAVGGSVYFLADDVEHGIELWRSDGTEAGTRRVSEIGYHSPFFEEMLPSQIEELAGGKLAFIATDDAETYKLWATSGTPESTTLVADSGQDLARLPGGRLIFTRGSEAWSTDGTAAGTFRVAEQVRTRPFALLGAVFFDSKGEIWRSDGTLAGTRAFSDLPEQDFSRAHEIAEAGGRIVFLADDFFYGTELWATNGRLGGTELLADLSTEPESFGFNGLMELNGKLLFLASVPVSDNPPSNVIRLFSSAGSPETTVGIDLPVANCNVGLPWSSMLRAGDKAFFDWLGTNCKATMWVTDGTPQGTHSLGIEPILEKTVFKDQVFYTRTAPGVGPSLWKLDSTTGEEVKVFDFPAEARSADGLTASGPDLYFLAWDGNVSQVWRSDGTLAGTRRLTSFPEPDTNIGGDPQFTRAGNFVFFREPNNYPHIWRTDGTPEGTIRIADRFDDDAPMDLVAFKGSLYFFQLINGEGDILFKSDGTRDGTVQIRKFEVPDDYGALPHHPLVFGDHLYFVASDGAHGLELWRTDGTAAGTTLVRDIFPGEPYSFPQNLTKVGGQIFFLANDGAHGLELWRSDGTAAGTRMVQDLYPGRPSSYAGGFTPLGDKLFFGASDGAPGVSLWALPLGASAPCQPSDKTLCLSGGRFKVEATWRVRNGKSGPGYARALSPDTGYFFFFDENNVEVMLKVLDGRGSNGHFWVYYGALSNVEYHLTVTDTQTGLTRRYFNPQRNFASVGDSQAFGPRGASEVKSIAAPSPAPDVHERLDLAEATGTCVPGATRLCLNQGRFAVDVAWEDFSGNVGSGKAVGLTGDTGYFWFFDDDNVELVIKVLDGTAVNGKHWVYYGALSDVKYDITITDTLTGQQKVYRNAKGRFASAGDPSAF